MTSAPRARRIVGLDFGLARIGISVSDEQKIIATPLMTLKCEKRTEDTVAKLIRELKSDENNKKYLVEEIVIGLPLMMSGKKGFLADETLHFVELLRKSIDIPVNTWDERLTTVQAERSIREGPFSRKKRSQMVDKVAAVIILQNYLDHKSLSTN